MENWVEINLTRLKNNYEYIKKISGKPICAVIKADGYGVGSYEIAKELEELGVKSFAVAFLQEALELRKFGIESEILILNYVSYDKLSEIEDDKLIFSIYSLDQLKTYMIGKSLNKYRFHIKLNSGMNRLGINREEIPELCEIALEEKMNVEGIYSHFAHVEDEEFTKFQYENFMEMGNTLEDVFEKKLLRHISNSGGVLKYPTYTLDFVRVGMGLYGLQPLEQKDLNIKGIITWKSKISAIREVKKGERISYGKEVLEESKKIAIIPVGYAHGYMRQLKKDAFVIVKGRRCRILGKVFMDQMMIDVSNIEVSFGDEVVLLGDTVEASVIGEFSDTIADDVISKISPRIERVFIKE